MKYPKKADGQQTSGEPEQETIELIQDNVAQEEINIQESDGQQEDVKTDLNNIPLTLSDADIERAASDLGIEGLSKLWTYFWSHTSATKDVSDGEVTDSQEESEDDYEGTEDLQQKNLAISDTDLEIAGDDLGTQGKWVHTAGTSS